MIRAVKFASAVLVFFGLFVPSYALALPQFHGKLNHHLSLGVGYIPIFWRLATPAQRSVLGSLITPSDQAWIGQLSFGPDPSLNFEAALVKSKSGDYCLYVDRSLTGRLTASAKIAITPEKAPRLPHATFSLPLQHGPYKTFPVSIMVRRGYVYGNETAQKDFITLFVSFGASLRGIVQLPSRKLLVSYQYNLSTNTIDLATTEQGMDLNGDGKIGVLSEQDHARNGKLPIFKIGNLYLRNESVDTKTGEITLASIPASVVGNRIFWQNGDTLPNFPITPLIGPSTTFAKLKGKITLIDFWASWCEPCMEQFPVLKKAYAKYHSRGLQIIGINGDHTTRAALNALAEVKAPWPQVRGDKLISRFQIIGWPSEILVDANGKVLASSNTAPTQGDLIIKLLEKFIPAQ